LFKILGILQQLTIKVKNEANVDEKTAIEKQKFNGIQWNSKEKCVFSVYFAKKKKNRKIQISIGPKHSYLFGAHVMCYTKKLIDIWPEFHNGRSFDSYQK
jgi:antitoxin component YwqK of YwqJK toxin-antitoxin module